MAEDLSIHFIKMVKTPTVGKKSAKTTPKEATGSKMNKSVESNNHNILIMATVIPEPQDLSQDRENKRYRTDNTDQITKDKENDTECEESVIKQEI